MGKQPHWFKWLIRVAPGIAVCCCALDAVSAPGYLAWVQPSPLRFAPRKGSQPLPPEFQEARATSPVQSGASDATNAPAVTLQPGVSPDPGSAPEPAEQAEAPAPPTEDLVTGPEAMFSTPVPATQPLILITPQSLVELMRMHGTNAAYAPPSNFEAPVFIPPAPPASRATYHSAPASNP